LKQELRKGGTVAGYFNQLILISLSSGLVARAVVIFRFSRPFIVGKEFANRLMPT
jgi:hypothetical protein